jgi:hypothetical protein
MNGAKHVHCLTEGDEAKAQPEVPWRVGSTLKERWSITEANYQRQYQLEWASRPAGANKGKSWGGAAEIDRVHKLTEAGYAAPSIVSQHVNWPLEAQLPNVSVSREK